MTVPKAYTDWYRRADGYAEVRYTRQHIKTASRSPYLGGVSAALEDAARLVGKMDGENFKPAIVAAALRSLVPTP